MKNINTREVNQQLEHRLATKFGLITKINGNCKSASLPQQIEERTVAELEQLISKHRSSLVTITFMDAPGCARNTKIKTIIKNSRVAKQLREIVKAGRQRKANRNKESIEVLADKVSVAQLTGIELLERFVEELDNQFGEYNGPVREFQRILQKTDRDVSPEEVLEQIAFTVHNLVKNFKQQLQPKTDLQISTLLQHELH